MDKSLVRAVCIDDFALKKGQRYGTIMVDMQSHQIIDMIESRESYDVNKWLQSYPNIEIVSRDGSLIYATAISNAHPDATQISDRFHLIKNLHERAKQYLINMFNGRIRIPITSKMARCNHIVSIGTITDKVLLVKEMRAEGRSKSEISALTKIAVRTVKKYIEMQEEDITRDKQTVREIEHRNAINKVLEKANRCKFLKEQGFGITEISKETGFNRESVKRYLSHGFNPVNGHYGNKREGKLLPYHKDILSMRAQGHTYKKIHEFIKSKGYNGTVDAIRGFISKERRLNSDMNKDIQSELIDKKWIIRLLYRPIEKVKGITEEQLAAVVKAYPSVAIIYEIVREFKKIMKSKSPSKLQTWMKEVSKLNIDEFDTFIGGLKQDIYAVTNAIIYDYNNGLAEGSVNKLKVIKRIMYGRCSFELLKNKVLKYEKLRSVN